MYYIHYLSSLCHRRRWPDPLYESYQASNNGYYCTVRVNHREYQTDACYETDTLARENAAMRAYLICRNFSHNDGMYPSGMSSTTRSSSGVVQGIPVAIGTGRYGNDTSSSSSDSSPRGSPKERTRDERRSSRHYGGWSRR